MSRSILAGMAAVEWGPGRLFRLEGVQFAHEDFGDFYEGGDALPVMRTRACLDAYRDGLCDLEVRNMMELGVRVGGSPVFLALLFEPEKLVCLDIGKPATLLERFRAQDPRGARIAPYYRTSQDDESALTAMLEREIEGPLDLVIDDASHFYAETRASFEILFPRLKPGGVYAVEDWSWAHVPGFAEWRDQPTLSNLVFQLMMIAAAHPKLIASITVTPEVAFVRKGTAAANDERLDVEGLCWMQGRTFHLL